LVSHVELLKFLQTKSILPLFVVAVYQSVLGFAISTAAIAVVVGADAVVAASGSAAEETLDGGGAGEAGGAEDDGHVLESTLAGYL
jgi:hypothetical protein